MLRALLLCISLRAGDAQAEAHALTTIHRLVVSAPEADAGVSLEGLVSALESQLSELGVVVQISDASPDKGLGAQESSEKVLAFVWVVRDGESLSVHLLEAAGESLRQRRLPLSAADSASVEAVAIVVRSAVAALLDRMNDEEIPARVPPKSAPEPAIPAAPEPMRSKDRPLLFALGWTGQSYAPRLGLAHGAVWDVAVRPSRSIFVVGANYSFFAAQERVAAGSVVGLRRHPFEIYVGADSRGRQRPVFLLAQSGLNMDLVQRKTLETDSDLEREPDTLRTSWALALRAGIGIMAHSRLSLVLLGGPDVLLSRVPVVLDTGGSEQAILIPHRVRPRLAAQLSWHLP